jgi:hypothetical protein
MNMYTVVNVENLNLYEPPMIMDGEDGIQIPIVDYFSLDYLDKLYEDMILDRRIRTKSRVEIDRRSQIERSLVE